MLDQSLAFVDVETTGSAPPKAQMTEIAVVRADPDGQGGWTVRNFSTLLNPQQAIPIEIQRLTGITTAMVHNAPRFFEVAQEVQQWLADAIFVAHHARFDFGFVKSAFAQAQIDWHAKTLCTVRMSRLLDPDRSPHGLDALIDRYRLSTEARHRALGDARLLWDLWQAWLRRKGDERVFAAARLLLRQPSLPEHLEPECLKRIPHAPGVYRFYGLNDHPLYIGKSVDLRTRVSSHFVLDHRSERGMRLAQEVRRIECEPTAGETTALLLEQLAIATEMPAHNRALRRSSAAFVRLGPDGFAITTALPDNSETQAHDRWFGPFAGKAAARRALRDAAHAARACAASLGLERHVAGTPCFSRQIGKCSGACLGEQTRGAQMAALAEAMQAHHYQMWPYGDRAAVFEESDDSGQHHHRFVIRQWTVVSLESRDKPPRTMPLLFLVGVYRLLCTKVQHQLVPLDQ